MKQDWNSLKFKYREDSPILNELCCTFSVWDEWEHEFVKLLHFIHISKCTCCYLKPCILEIDQSFSSRYFMCQIHLHACQMQRFDLAVISFITYICVSFVTSWSNLFDNLCSIYNSINVVPCLLIRFAPFQWLLFMIVAFRWYLCVIIIFDISLFENPLWRRGIGTFEPFALTFVRETHWLLLDSSRLFYWA